MSRALYEIMVTIRSVHDYDKRTISVACSETSPGDVKPLIIATKDTGVESWRCGTWTELVVEIEVER